MGERALFLATVAQIAWVEVGAELGGKERVGCGSRATDSVVLKLSSSRFS